MKKHIIDFKVTDCERLGSLYAMLTLVPADGRPLPEMLPGQFVQVSVPDSPSTFLRRPISICNADSDRGELTLLVRNAGEGTRHMVEAKPGDIFNLLLPLGNGFDINPEFKGKRLLVGGGVGIAPLYYLGRRLKMQGADISFLIGARSEKDLLMIDALREIAPVYISTDDGTAGDRGLVTANRAWQQQWDMISCCGPAPMMKAVAKIAWHAGIECEVSLENMMACGLGACLCCVEKTVKGNVCVCTEGPVFNINQLTWQD